MKWNTDADWQRVIEKTRNMQTYACVYPDGTMGTVSYEEVLRHNIARMRTEVLENVNFERTVPDARYIPSLREEILENPRNYDASIIGLWQDFLRWMLVHPGEKIAYDRKTDLYTDYVFFLARHRPKNKVIDYLDSRENEHFGIE